MAAKGENTRCLYKDGDHKIVTIGSDEEKAAKKDGWGKPGEPKEKEKEEIPQLTKPKENK